MATAAISTQQISTTKPTIVANELSEGRYEQLDGLRGIAALVVFLFHAVMMAVPDPSAVRVLSFPLFRPFWDGPGAVTLFFVLSGFVLTLPYTGPEPRKLHVFPFLIRRVARLYPAYWAGLVLALVFRSFVFHPEGVSGLSPWTGTHWRHAIGWLSIVKHFFMISPGIDVDDINPVVWSLIIEMKVSLVLPLLIFVVKRTPRSVHSLSILVLITALTTPLHFVSHSSSSWSRAAILVPIFLLGSYLAKYRKEAVDALKTSRVVRIVVGITGAFLYALVWIIPAHYQSLARYGCAGGSAAIILLFLTSARLRRLGTTRPASFLGKVSYSFYMVHLPILIALTSFLYSFIPSLVEVIAIALICSLVTAWVICSTVELPAHDWGKRLAWSIGAMGQNSETCGAPLITTPKPF